MMSSLKVPKDSGISDIGDRNYLNLSFKTMTDNFESKSEFGGNKAWNFKRNDHKHMYISKSKMNSTVHHGRKANGKADRSMYGAHSVHNF